MKMNLPRRFFLKSRIFLTVLVLLTFVFSPFRSQAFAGATLYQMSDTLSSMAAATSSTHSYSFKVTSTTAITSLSITVSTAWASVPSTTAGSYTLKDNATTETISTVTNTSTSVLTFAITSFTPANGDTITLVTPAITNWSSGTYTETLNTGTETGQLAVLIVAAGANQISISAQVAPSIAFTVSPSSLTLPAGGGTLNTLDATGNHSNNATLTLSTNAANGATVAVGDSNAGLLLANPSHTIPAVAGGPTTLSVEGYGLGESAAPSSGTLGTKYNTSGYSQVGNLATTAATLWSVTSAVSAVTATPYFNAYITGSTPAGTYTDTVTFTATASF